MKQVAVTDLAAYFDDEITAMPNLVSVGTITTGVWNATDIAVAHGGTGASTPAAALTNLGAAKASTKFVSVIGASGLAAETGEINTGITTANFGAASTSSGGAAHTTEVYVNGQLMMGGTNSSTDNDYFEGSTGDGYLSFEFALVENDIVTVIVR